MPWSHKQQPHKQHISPPQKTNFSQQLELQLSRFTPWSSGTWNMGRVQGKMKVVEKDTCQGNGPHRYEGYLHSSSSSLSNEGDCARLWEMSQNPRSLQWQRKPRSLHRQQISNYQSQVSWLRDRLFPWGFFACSFNDSIFYASLFSHTRSQKPDIVNFW